ncbi:hypothetical protein DYZ94_25540 [Klebsiella variicola]|nr:hypothetical protein CYD38_12120 [Klebsiella variicola]REI49461.1 hypothetical protein DYB09_15110 [Klebsiella variicola]REI49634.1 hypothetical protein DY002_12995 [Klebsiella variicola]REI58016.1 hypothetical protein DY007_27770 [Klebsiella variicola]REI62319.1 hypothetical protein DYZ94_25540 [Klebsiella variicola]
MMSLWDALRMNMMISYQELVRTFPSNGLVTFTYPQIALNTLGDAYAKSCQTETALHRTRLHYLCKRISAQIIPPVSATEGLLRPVNFCNFCTVFQ